MLKLFPSLDLMAAKHEVEGQCTGSGARVYHLYLNESYYVNLRGVSITNTIPLAELAATMVTMVTMVTMGGDLQPGCLADWLLTGLVQPQINT